MERLCLNTPLEKLKEKMSKKKLKEAGRFGKLRKKNVSEIEVGFF